MSSAALSTSRAARVFRPRMEAQTHDLRTLKPLAFRTLSGAVADVWHVEGEKGGGGYYTAPDPRLVVFLDDTPPDMMLKTTEHDAGRLGTRAFFVPAGVPLWTQLGQAQSLSHVDFHLDVAALHARLITAGFRDVPRKAMFASDNASLLALARLAAREVETPQRGGLMLDGLLQALLGEVIDSTPDAPAQTCGGLPPHQMAAIEHHMMQNIERSVGVAELAQVAGLSESWFSRVFKQSAGLSPQRWIVEQRVAAAKDMMSDPKRSLADIAVATGFSDQAHLSRAFRRAVGLPPSQWRRDTKETDLRWIDTNGGAFVQDVFR